MERLAFIKCYCCAKTYNKMQLIEMSKNTVMINEEELEYKDLFLDTILCEIDSSKTNYICTDCNNNLLSFHFFKRDVKKYNDFGENIRKLKFLSKLEVFLDAAENIADLHVHQDQVSFTISLGAELEEESRVAQEIEKEEEIAYEDSELVEYDCQELPENDSDNEVTDSDQECQSEKKPISFLNPSQLEWIKDEIKSSEVRKGRRTAYKCSVCLAILSTAASLSRHLQDLHIIVENNAEKCMERKQREEFQAEVKASRVNVMTKTGPESTWKCQRCEEDRTYKSEQSFKFHLRSMHVNKFNDSEKTNENSVKVEEDEKEVSGNFFEVESLEEEYLDDDVPASKKRKLNTLDDLDEVQITWIRNKVAAGEVMQGKTKVYKCMVCKQVLTTQASLTRHLRDVHVLKSGQDDKAAFKKEVNSSKLIIETSGGIEQIWKCPRCENDRIFKSEQAFKLHLRMTHIRATRVDTAFIAACKTTITEADGPRHVWKCPDCSRIFRHRDTLRNHIKIEHPNMNEEDAKKKMLEAAPDIDQNYAAMSRIVQKLEHKEIGKSLNFCHECGLKFATAKHHLKPKVHRECHETFKILAPHLPHYKCDSCRVLFNNEESLNHHSMLHGSPDIVHLIPAEGLSQFGANHYKVPAGDADDAVDEAVWKCAHCPVRYFDENDCLTHIMLLHSSPIFCCIDNREFDGSSGFSKFLQHMKNKHPELFPDLKYPCGSCRQEFPSIYEKLAHQKNCKNKKIECDYCGKRFLTKHQLLSHMLYEIGLSGYSCEVCGKRCKTLSDLKIHQNIHTNARPYVCSVCPKTFKTPGARSTHMESHNFEKIECEHCGQKLANRTLYKRHMRFQHNQEFRDSQLEKNVCGICNKSFLRTSHYKQHIKQQHGIQQ